MNRQQAKDLLPIIQAFAEGKIIEFKSAFGKWTDCNDVLFNYPPKNYRIKPGQKYRPFANKEECWQEMLKHQPFGWIKEAENKYNIVFIGRYGITFNNGVGNGYYDFKKTFNLKFADDTPFGIKEEE